MSIVDLTLSNLKLFKGAHESPDNPGGLCVNEAAILFAGYAYRPIYNARNCPRTFSRIISTFALSLNDEMDDAARNTLLLPFIPRLPHTAAKATVETLRVEFIMLQAATRIFPNLIRFFDRPLTEHRFATFTTLDELENVVSLASTTELFELIFTSMEHGDPLSNALRHMAKAIDNLRKSKQRIPGGGVKIAAIDRRIEATDQVGMALGQCALILGQDAVWPVAVQILSDAIDLGRPESAFALAA